MLFKAASQTLLTIAKDPKHLGAQIGMIMILHTWGSAMTHHPHVHCILPGRGISADKQQWQACKTGFFYLFGCYLVCFGAGMLMAYGDLIELIEPKGFSDWCAEQQYREWVVYAKRPFAGPEAVLAYLSRYTHPVAIANSRLRQINEKYVSFTYKDYRLKGHTQHKTMQLETNEFIRRFMLHVLPSGLDRIRHYGLLVSQTKLALARKLLNVPAPAVTTTLEPVVDQSVPFQCRQ